MCFHRHLRDLTKSVSLTESHLFRPNHKSKRFSSRPTSLLIAYVDIKDLSWSISFEKEHNLLINVITKILHKLTLKNAYLLGNVLWKEFEINVCLL